MTGAYSADTVEIATAALILLGMVVLISCAFMGYFLFIDGEKGTTRTLGVVLALAPIAAVIGWALVVVTA